MATTITERRDLRLEQLYIDKFQVRNADPGKDIDELEDTIRIHGVLQPIMVAPSGANDERYEIVMGQRRFIACRNLQMKTIPCQILSDTMDVHEAKTLSVIENMSRVDLPQSDYIDVCTELFRHYGSNTLVAQKTGLPKHKVDKYVKYDRLMPALQSKVSAGTPLDDALRAQRAAELGNDQPDPEDALDWLQTLESLSGREKTEVLKAKSQHPSVQAIEAVELVNNLVETTLTIHLGEIAQHVNNFADSNGYGNTEDAALQLISDALELHGFSDETP
jgi:ParB family chromosome partitioning protein